MKIILVISILTLNAFANCVLFLSKEYEHNGKKYKACGDYFVMMDYQVRADDGSVNISYDFDLENKDIINNDFFFNSRNKIEEFKNKNGIIFNDEGISKVELSLKSYDFLKLKKTHSNIHEGLGEIERPEEIKVYKLDTNIKKKYRFNIFSQVKNNLDLNSIRFEKINDKKIVLKNKEIGLKTKYITDFQKNCEIEYEGDFNKAGFGLYLQNKTPFEKGYLIEDKEQKLYYSIFDDSTSLYYSRPVKTNIYIYIYMIMKIRFYSSNIFVKDKI